MLIRIVNGPVRSDGGSLEVRAHVKQDNRDKEKSDPKYDREVTWI